MVRIEHPIKTRQKVRLQRGMNMVRKWYEHGTNMVRTWYEQHRRIWYEYGTNMVRIMATDTLNVPFQTHGASR